MKTLFKPVFLTNIIITRLIKYIMAVVGDMVKSIISVNYKVIVEAFMEVYFKVITKINATFTKNQIAS